MNGISYETPIWGSVWQILKASDISVLAGALSLHCMWGWLVRSIRQEGGRLSRVMTLLLGDRTIAPLAPQNEVHVLRERISDTLIF